MLLFGVSFVTMYLRVLEDNHHSHWKNKFHKKIENR